MSLDTSFWYRLTNNFQGPGQALDVKADGSGRLKMAATADYSGQHWRLVELGSAKYALRTEYLGDCFSLDVINEGAKNTPWLNATGNYSGQSWSLTPWSDRRTYKLSNDFNGPEKSLNVYGESFEPFVDTGDHSGQHWVFTPLRKITGNAAIPQLGVMANNNNQNEGPTNYGVFATPQGTIRAVMVFVDFPDAPFSEPPSAAGDRVLGQFKQLFHDQSYGKLTVQVDVRADLGWHRMTKDSSVYHLGEFGSQKAYITDAAKLFPRFSVLFGAYSFVFIVPSRDAKPPVSVGFNPVPGQGVPTSSGEIRLAVTLGQDIYKDRYITLVHETGHLFGLPDLYPSGLRAEESEAGCWDIMSDSHRSVSFFGWHRHKFGWLDPSRELYIAQSTSGWNLTLSPVSGGCGVSMVVLPIDDATNPSKVFVVELAQPILGRKTDHSWGEGILLYTVDAKLTSGMSPVVILRNDAHVNTEYGRLYDVPFGVGESRSYTVDGATLGVTVIKKFGSCYDIRISYKKSSSWITAVLDAIRNLIAGFYRLFRSVFRLPFPPDRRPAAPDPESHQRLRPTRQTDSVIP
jgi:hypothetical protein